MCLKRKHGLFDALKPETKRRDFKFISDVREKAADILSDGVTENDLIELESV